MQAVRHHSMEMVEVQPQYAKHDKQSLKKIFSFLGYRDLAKVTKVSRAWRAAAIDPELWNRFRLNVFARSIAFGRDFERHFPVLNFTHLGVEGNVVQMKVKNEDKLIFLNRFTGEIQTRKTTINGEAFFVNDAGILTFETKQISFRYNDGRLFILPLWFDYNNEYKHQHLAMYGHSIFVLEPNGLMEIDLNSQNKKVLFASRDYDHQQSSIHFVDRFLVVFWKKLGFEGEVEIWDSRKRAIIFKETAWSMRAMCVDNEFHLYLEHLQHLRIYNLSRRTQMDVKVPNKMCKDLRHYESFSRSVVKIEANMLHIYHVPSNSYHVHKFEVDSLIMSVKKVSILGIYVLCHEMRLDNSTHESSIWMISGDRLRRVRKLEGIYSDAFLLNGVFYQMIMHLNFNCELRVIDNLHPPYGSLKPVEQKQCSLI